MSDVLVTAYQSALQAMQARGPRDLHAMAAMVASPDQLAPEALGEHLRAAGPEDALRQSLAHFLAGWDYEGESAEWTIGTEPRSPERRAKALQLLQLDESTRKLFNDLFPVAESGDVIVIADKWTEWRTESRRHERDYYWSHYRDLLLSKGWPPESVAGLDRATEEVIRRLSDPIRQEAYQAKGLVVGHVQSGKTANFTGVTAKAIDAGYRLVIVLTGTTNMLRAQTQRRLDVELCGRENLEREISPLAPERYEYFDDPAWPDGFVSHGGRPSESDHPDVRRLSKYTTDYKRLDQGWSFEYERRERQAPLYDPRNLYTSHVRLVVTKKNSRVLENLTADLGRFTDRLAQVPALIIDDESDQASVNTTSPSKWKQDAKERTAINRLIGDLLRIMPRAQYVGYTATPYANVFIDPSDDEDVFPRDFIVALPRPVGYMGAEDFHDRDGEGPVSSRPYTESNERSHVRLLEEEPDESELRTALDLFVLTGAVKKHRLRKGEGKFEHHTMLVHEAMGRDSHRETADVIRRLWREGDYTAPAGLARLEALYRSDILPASQSLAPQLGTPTDFSDLHGDLARALADIQPRDRHGDPVIVVNSDPDLDRQRESLDFDKRGIWRILVGGNKLARGFTVEGLTITYYRRATSQVDTLMQMGRWFGFRPGYRDLVRVFTTSDLHEMFAAACADEEYLRSELQKYASSPSGRSQLTPREVPPLIGQHRPDLRPTGRNKMWNAQLVERRSPGMPMEPVAYPSGGNDMKFNTKMWMEVLAPDPREVIFPAPRGASPYRARYQVLGHRRLVGILNQLRWMAADTFQPDLRWLTGLSPSQISSWVVYVPFQKQTSSLRTIDGEGPFSIYTRARAQSGALKVASEGRHRLASQILSGPEEYDVSSFSPEFAELCVSRRAALLLYPTFKDKEIPGDEGDALDPQKITMAFRLTTPVSAKSDDDELLKWVTMDKRNPQAITTSVR